MNKRSRISASTRSPLFDLNGNSSIGALPRGKIVVRSTPVPEEIVLTTRPSANFHIGAMETVSANGAQPKGVFGRPSNGTFHQRTFLSPDSEVEKRREQAAQIAEIGNGFALPTATEEFLNQGVVNPIKNAVLK